MKIDWKALAQAPGYQSLKAAMVRDIQEAHREIQKGFRPMRKKAEFQAKFRWVIARAMHYAHHQDRTMAEVLNEWEAKRNYWWLNYYQECGQPLLAKYASGYPRTLRGRLRLVARDPWNRHKTKAEISRERCDTILRHHKQERSGRRLEKARWDMDRKRAQNARKTREKNL